jgi:beta-lactamase class D
LKTRPRGYSFNNPSYLGWMVGWIRWKESQ